MAESRGWSPASWSVSLCALNHENRAGIEPTARQLRHFCRQLAGFWGRPGLERMPVFCWGRFQLNLPSIWFFMRPPGPQAVRARGRIFHRLLSCWDCCPPLKCGWSENERQSRQKLEHWAKQASGLLWVSVWVYRHLFVQCSSKTKSWQWITLECAWMLSMM